MSLYHPEWLDRSSIERKYGHFRPSLLRRENPRSGGTLALYKPKKGSWADYQTAAQARAVEDALRPAGDDQDSGSEMDYWV